MLTSIDDLFFKKPQLTLDLGIIVAGNCKASFHPILDVTVGIVAGNCKASFHPILDVTVGIVSGNCKASFHPILDVTVVISFCWYCCWKLLSQLPSDFVDANLQATPRAVDDRQNTYINI